MEQVTVNGNTATQTVSFLNPITSLTASGNVTVTGNVTAATFLGDGTQLLGVATRLELTNNVTSIRNDITSNALRITNIESYTTGGQSGQVLTSTGSTPTWSTVTPSLVGLPSPYTSGDILYATSSTQLAKLSLGEAGQVLKSDGLQPVWATDLTGGSGGGGAGVWTATGINNTIYYDSGNVGIATDAPMADLQVGSNVQISDTDTDKIKVTGNIYISKNLQVLDDVDCFQVKTTNMFIKKQVVTAQPARTSTVMIL